MDEFEDRGEALQVSANVPAAGDLRIRSALGAYQNVRHASFAGFDEGSSAAAAAAPDLLPPEDPGDGIGDGDGNGEDNTCGIYAQTRFGDTAQVHRVSAGPMGYREQMTYADEPVRCCIPNPAAGSIGDAGADGEDEGDEVEMASASASPPRRWPPPGFIYGLDRGGNEQVQFYLCDTSSSSSSGVDGERHSLLTDGKSMNYSVEWCRSTGRRIAYTSNAADGVHFDVYVLTRRRRSVPPSSSPAVGGDASDAVPVSAGETMDRSLVYDMRSGGRGAGYTSIRGFAGNQMLIQQYVSVSDSSLFLLRVSTASDWGREGVAPEEIPIAPMSKSAASKSSSDGGGGSEADKASVHCGTLLPGGRGVLYCSDEAGLFRSLFYLDLVDKDAKPIPVAPSIMWNVEDVAVGRDGDVVVVYNEDGRSAFYYGRLSMPDMEAKSSTPSSPFLGGDESSRLRKLPWDANLYGVVTSGTMEFCRIKGQGRRFGFSLSSSDGPTDAYVADFDSHEDPLRVKPVAWTRSEVGGLDRSRFVRPHLVHYTSFDGLKIPAFVYCPNEAVVRTGRGRFDVKRRKVDGDDDPSSTSQPTTATAASASEEALIPVIIHPHGGPEGQHRPLFHPFYQYLVGELGVCVIDPNVRGSAGYGKEFVNLDNCEKREDSVKDIGSLLDWIDGQGKGDDDGGREGEGGVDDDGGRVRFLLDGKMVAVWGGSYGGYMCLASLIHFPDRFACGVDMVGISNFVTFLENTAHYRRDLRRLKYGDERDPTMRELLTKFSPLTKAHGIVAPLFVAQGANDPRVPLSEARQIYDAARGNGQEVWWMLARNEGHGFRRKSNVDAYQEAIVQFFRRFLLNVAPQSPEMG